MPPVVALLLCIAFILYLFARDPSRDPRVSGAVWITLIWMLIQGARLPSQWAEVSAPNAGDAIQDGNSFDRAVYLALIIIAIGILASRSVRWGSILSRNPALTVLILLGLVSVTWSDFPFIAFKRWFRDLGTYLMVVIHMTEMRPLESLETLIRRFSYITILLSVVLIKYYPQVGMAYDFYNGAPYTLGITLNKNQLGVLSLVSGLYFTWDIVRRFAERKDKRVRRILYIDAILLIATIWVLLHSLSSTSLLSYEVAVVIMLLSRTRWIRESPARLAVVLPLGALSFVVLDTLFGLRGLVTSSVGRDTTFTGRTNLWSYLGNLDKNWLVGAGYESFWLGPRLDAAWNVFHWGPTQAHNGYLEMYIELGLVGLVTLALVLFFFYRRIYRDLSVNPSYAVLTLSFFVVNLIYNYTEAAFRNCLLWFTFLMINLISLNPGEEAAVAIEKTGPKSRMLSGPSRMRKRIVDASH